MANPPAPSIQGGVAPNAAELEAYYGSADAAKAERRCMQDPRDYSAD